MGNGLIRRNGFSEHWLRPWETLDRSMFDPIFPFEGFSFSGIPLDLQKTETGYKVEAELPGFTKEEVEVTLDRGVLRIAASKVEHGEEKREGYLRRERRYKNVERLVRLPEEVDEEKVEASMKNGVLTITLSKLEGGGRKKISIEEPEK